MVIKLVAPMSPVWLQRIYREKKENAKVGGSYVSRMAPVDLPGKEGERGNAEVTCRDYPTRRFLHCRGCARVYPITVSLRQII
ncbi:hypothetical protein NDU88_004318 [Pleurodeles waltl]|uniref:Uncharacterized protein n=1 Tax=Pleurodeles waltl TaxID=8319 RepID=A0AAV7MT42_PLEWA|nr:hypothetical protein NDU88_004318 [Pleurodeles waltl]